MNPHLLYVLHAVSPLHVGVDEGLGAIDLPTMRERHTHYPLVPGSSIKGVLRQEAETRLGRESDDVFGAFGPPQSRAGDFRGGLVFTDASLLALPIRSLCGTFAWVTCPLVVRRLGRDLETAGIAPPASLPEDGETRLGWVADAPADGKGSALLVPPANTQVFLEELLLDVRTEPAVGKLADRLALWFWPGDSDARRFFRQRFLVVHDDVFGFFVRIGLEVRARVRIDEKRGTAADSGPWTEEHMPAETLLHGLAFGRPTLVTERLPKEPKPGGGSAEASGSQPGVPWEPERSLQVLKGLGAEGALLRFGGHATIGLGRAHFRLVSASATPQENPQ